MRLLVGFLLLTIFFYGCNSANTPSEKPSDKDWEIFRNNFPEISLPYTFATEGNIDLSKYKLIDSSVVLRFLNPTNIPKEVTGVYYSVGQYSKDNYTFILYAYELTGIQGMRLAAYDAKGKKLDELLFWSSEWLDNPAGKSNSSATIQKDGDISLLTWKYATDSPTEEELKNANPSSKTYYSFLDEKFNNRDETSVEK